MRQKKRDILWKEIETEGKMAKTKQAWNKQIFEKKVKWIQDKKIHIRKKGKKTNNKRLNTRNERQMKKNGRKKKINCRG